MGFAHLWLYEIQQEQKKTDFAKMQYIVHETPETKFYSIGYVQAL